MINKIDCITIGRVNYGNGIIANVNLRFNDIYLKGLKIIESAQRKVLLFPDEIMALLPETTRQDIETVIIDKYIQEI